MGKVIGGRGIEKILLEFGKGFAFVGTQYRLTLAEDSFYADLVFIIFFKHIAFIQQLVGQIQKTIDPSELSPDLQNLKP